MDDVHQKSACTTVTMFPMHKKIKKVVWNRIRITTQHNCASSFDFSGYFLHIDFSFFFLITNRTNEAHCNGHTCGFDPYTVRAVSCTVWLFIM